MTLIIIIVIVVLLLLFIMTNYNSLVKLREMVKNSMANIAAQVESRWDAVSSLIEATKKYSEHEASLLRDITEKRTNIDRDASARDVERDDDAFSKALTRINAVAEAYPDLKASEVYKSTMNSINSYEENVRMSRMIYNDTVTKLNTKIQSFPSNIVASMFGFKQEEYFKNSSGKTDMPSW
ncbi:LemA family protein [Peptoniphilus sp.]|jgi:LemA protein|uniref:LemA family protein n=1 Tax=Peptoniphilus sp. TaxID=1971214 RepID=UPI003D8B4232